MESSAYKCQICDMSFTGPEPRRQHFDSKKHKKRVQSHSYLSRTTETVPDSNVKKFNSSSTENTCANLLATFPRKNPSQDYHNGNNIEYHAETTSVMNVFGRSYASSQSTDIALGKNFRFCGVNDKFSDVFKKQI